VVVRFQKHAFHFPIEKDHQLTEHIDTLGTTISERVRELLLIDMETTDASSAEKRNSDR
jgi:hypothetical protein